MGRAIASHSPAARRYTLVAAFDGAQWSSLCRELDLASCGATAEEALDALEQAVREALAYERDTGVSAGRDAPDSALRELLDDEHGGRPQAARSLLI